MNDVEFGTTIDGGGLHEWPRKRRNHKTGRLTPPPTHAKQVSEVSLRSEEKFFERIFEDEQRRRRAHTTSSDGKRGYRGD